MTKKRVHILSAVNASAVSYASGVYTIAGVCGAVDDIVMNGMLYPGDELRSGVASLEGKPAPAGHPKNASGQHISALNGEALLTHFCGAICRNARHEGGRTLVDVVVNEAQAKAHKDGAALVDRLQSAVNGSNAEPIHVSTGLFSSQITANGESRGKKYSRIATGIQYDHLAILLNEQGAGTPADGVGMFLNSDGQALEVEVAQVKADAADRRFEGLTGWIRRLIGNTDLSFDAIQSALHTGLPDGAWLREVFDRYAVWTDQNGRLWRDDYSISSEGQPKWAGQPTEVVRKVSYEAISANQEESNPMKDKILAALNAAGIKTDGLDDGQLLSAYNSLVTKPVEDKLTAANSKLAAIELAANAAKEQEAAVLAKELAVNTSLTEDDLKKLGVDRLRELKANSQKAAPVAPGAGGQPADEFAGYSLNKIMEVK
jgi:hypothetical protein